MMPAHRSRRSLGAAFGRFRTETDILAGTAGNLLACAMAGYKPRLSIYAGVWPSPTPQLAAHEHAALRRYERHCNRARVKA